MVQIIYGTSIKLKLQHSHMNGRAGAKFGGGRGGGGQVQFFLVGGF